MFSASTKAASGTPPAIVDPQFNYVSMLLHGDGTNGAQNNTFLDSSTNNFTITRNGNTTQGSFSPYGSNWSNYFDGDGDYITVPDNAAFTLGTSNFTIEFLVYPLSGGGTSPIIFEHGQSGDWGAWIFQWISQNEIYFYAASSAGAGSYNVCNQSFGTLAKNQWTHICVTRNGSTFTGYKNGTSVFTSTSALGIQDQTAPVTIGRHYNSSAQDFNGYVSNARIVVGSVITPSAGGPTAPLTAVTNTVLLTCQSNRFIDNSANAFTVTPTGTPSVQRFNPFGASTAYSTSVIGGSGYFDGDGDYLTVPDDVQFTLTTSNYTMEMWVYPTTFSSLNVPFSYGWTSGSGTRLIVFIQNTDGTYQIYFNGSSNTFTTTNTVKLNAWNHLALVRNGSNFNFYINGVSSASATNSFSYSDSSFPIVIGSSWSGSTGQYFYTGYISDVRICVGVAIYTSGFTPPTAPLTATNTPALLCNMTNGAIYDNAMISNLETVGTAQISTSVVKYGTGSIYVNGQGNEIVCNTNKANISFGTGDFTIECWMYTGSSSGQNMLWSFDWFTGVGGWAFYLETYLGTGLVFHDGSGQNKASWTWSTNTWYHLVACRSGTSLRLFVDGTQLGSTFTNSTSVNALYDNVKIGSNNETYTIGFTGYIDDLRITKGYARYTANFTPPTAAFPNTGPY